MKPNTIDDFWNKVDKTGKCWLWTAGKDQDGYGLFWYKNKQWRAIRFIKQIIQMECVSGKEVRHTCDTPSCVRPDHLLIGTQLDNARDRESRGRGVKGRKQSPEHVAKKAESRRGKKWTQEMKDRMSRLKKGI